MNVENRLRSALRDAARDVDVDAQWEDLRHRLDESGAEQPSALEPRTRVMVRRRWAVPVAAAVAVALIGIGTGVAVSRARTGTQSPEPAAAHRSSTRSTPTVPVPRPRTTHSSGPSPARLASLPADWTPTIDAQNPACPATPVATTTTWPSDVRWSVLNGVRIATSPSVGPHRVTGDVGQCFAHSPIGALLATMHVAAETRGNHRSPMSWRHLKGSPVPAWIREVETHPDTDLGLRSFSDHFTSRCSARSCDVTLIGDVKGQTTELDFFVQWSDQAHDWQAVLAGVPDPVGIEVPVARSSNGQYHVVTPTAH